MCSGLLRFTRITTLITLLCMVHAQVPFPGSCPAVHGMRNFDASQYLGLWYEIKKYPFIFELGGKCVTAEYQLRNDGTISVNNTQINILTNKPTSIQGSATIVAPGELNVQFAAGVPATQGANYIVLDTDYDNYSVVFSCTNLLGVLNARIAWILARYPKPGNNVIRHAEKVLTDRNISLSFLTVTDQQNCPN